MSETTPQSNQSTKVQLNQQEFQKMVDELSGLREELAGFRSQRFVKLHNSRFRMVLFQLVRGMAFGLGSVLGATVVLGIVVYLLSSIDFIPIIGDWAREILTLVSGTQEEIIQHSQNSIQVFEDSAANQNAVETTTTSPQSSTVTE